MRTLIAVFFCLMWYNPNLLYSQIPNNTLQITYVANAGFLVASSTHKVLIDALIKGTYAPPKEITNDIMDSKPPFDSVGLYFITHYHEDHCDPVLVNEYLAKHRNVSLVTSRPTVLFINGNCYEFILLKNQFNELTPEGNQCVAKTIEGIPVKAFGLEHAPYYRNGIEMNQNMLNVSFLFEMDGIRVFHSGDIQTNAFRDYAAKNNKWTDTVDVALLCYGLFESGMPDLDYVVSTLHPKCIVVMHVPPDSNEACATRIEQFKTRFPNIILLKNSMDSQSIDISGMKNE